MGRTQRALLRAASVATLVAFSACAARSPAPSLGSPTAHATTAPDSAAALELANDLTQVFTDPSAGQAIWGVQVRSPDRDETLYSLNAHTLLIPSTLR